jgi:hypothetical protein
VTIPVRFEASRSTFLSAEDRFAKRFVRFEGVTDVKRTWFNEDRIKFLFHGEPFVVNEPFGDNSRYWIGPVEPPGDRAGRLVVSLDAIEASSGDGQPIIGRLS